MGNVDEAIWDARHAQYLDSIPGPNFSLQEDVEAIVAPDLAKPIAEIMEIYSMGEQANPEALMEACGKLHKALYERYRDI